MYYATLDFDNGRISEHAVIHSFPSFEEARAYLLSGFDPQYWDIESAVIKYGSFSDCWVKTYVFPEAHAPWLGDLTLSDIWVLHPGQHPGGNKYWITPNVNVLTIEIEEA